MSEAPIPKLTPEERAELRGKLQFAAVLGVDPFASIKVQSRQLAALLDENERLARTVAFFASVIKSGEPWTEDCERALAGSDSVKGAPASSQEKPE